MDKCTNCPVKGECVGRVHPPYCQDIANGLPGRAEQLLAIAGESPLPAEPSLWAKVGNFASAATSQLIAGNPIASQQLQDERKAICEACPLLVNGICSKCGCVAMDLKRSWLTSECPDGKW